MNKTNSVSVPDGFSHHMIGCTDSRNLQFVGKKLGEVEGIDMVPIKLSLYVTLAGNYVCVSEHRPIGRTRSVITASVHRTEEEIFGFFSKFKNVSKMLYEAAGLDDSMVID